VVYLGHNKVEVQSIDFPTMKETAGKDINYGAILEWSQLISAAPTQRVVRGHTTAPTAGVLGHEINA
jgi:glutathione-independent formaldehyde dehydrogenase